MLDRLWPCLTGCGHAWQVVAMLDRLWPCLTGCGHAWQVVAMHWKPVRFDTEGSIWYSIWLVVYCIMSRSKILRSYGDVTGWRDATVRPCSANVLKTERDLYRATPAVWYNPNNDRTIYSSCMTSKQGPYLTRIPRGFLVRWMSSED